MGPDPFLQLVPKRAAAVLRRLQGEIWRDRCELSVSATRPAPNHRTLAEIKGESRETVPAGATWGRLYDQRWFYIGLPDFNKERRDLYLEWQDQGEATLYIDGVPYYGFDPAHRRVALPHGVRDIWLEGICCQSGIWHPDATGLSAQGSRFDGAFLLERDDAAWTAFHDLQVLYDAMLHLRSQQSPALLSPPNRFGHQPSVENSTPLLRRLLYLLSQALNTYDCHGAAALHEPLLRAIDELREQRPVLRAALTGHAHLDLVWLWPERVGEAKAVHLFATANRLMTLYPEFRFAYSQPASYRAVQRRCPELFQHIRHQMQSGKWQATGAMDVESDTQLPCGEALARSFLYGQEEFKKLNGRPSRLLWLPDVFGYSGCLPQLMKLTGVDFFFTTKLTWSAINRFPYSSFCWRGADGSEVLTHVTQNAGYTNSLRFDELDANACGHVQSAVHPELLHPTGFGDGGGGPTEEMCERARRLGGLVGLPALSWDQPEAFFERLDQHRDLLPAYQGEFYLEYHRGTYTTHGDLKAAFRGAERALQLREATCIATGAWEDLTGPWRRVIFAQFHDYIPGSSVAEVYAEGVPELAQLAKTQIEAARQSLSDNCGAWHAFNPLPQFWRGWVNLPNGPRVWCELPPLSSAAIDSAATSTPPAPRAKHRTISNDRVAAEIDADGWLSRLIIDGKELLFSGPAARAVLYVDRPADFEAWDIDRHSLDLASPVNSPAEIVSEQTSTEEAVIRVSRMIGARSHLTVRYILRGGEPVLRLEADVDWQEAETLLKLHFPTHYRGLHARFGAPFGSALRGQLSGPQITEAQWEVPGSRWAAVSHDGETDGLAVVTEAKYGFCARDGDLTISLIRSARITGHEYHASAAPPGLSRLSVSSPFSDQGRHHIRLALTRYSAHDAELHPAGLADRLYSSPLLYQGAALSCGFVGIENAPTLIPAWAMPLPKGKWVLRFHEVSGVPGEAIVKLAQGWGASTCNLDGTGDQRRSKMQTRFAFRPYEIVSLLISPDAS